MKCSKCGQEIPDGSKFCLNCGAKIEKVDGIICPKCGYKNPLDALFCTECGSVLKIKKEEKKNINTPPSKLSFVVKGITFNMNLVQSGSFFTKYLSDEIHIHLTKDYYVGETAVTQALWNSVMGSNPSKTKSMSHPVTNISWYDCQKFIGSLNLITGKKFCLLTSYEWVFAARGGNKSRNNPELFSFPKTSWVLIGHTFPVAQSVPNELGIYDMMGTIFEWCEDWIGLDSLSTNVFTDPTGPKTGERKVLKGGLMHVNNQVANSPTDRAGLFGLRLKLNI